MKFEVHWSRPAINDLQRLSLKDADRITRKLNWFCKQTNPLAQSKSLGGSYEDIYRFRIGDYRVLFEIINGKVTILMILRVKHRREAYK